MSNGKDLNFHSSENELGTNYDQEKKKENVKTYLPDKETERVQLQHPAQAAISQKAAVTLSMK